MTSNQTYELRADIEDWSGNTAYSQHASVLVESEALDYTLKLGAYVGGDAGIVDVRLSVEYSITLL